MFAQVESAVVVQDTCRWDIRWWIAGPGGMHVPYTVVAATRGFGAPLSSVYNTRSFVQVVSPSSNTRSSSWCILIHRVSEVATKFCMNERVCKPQAYIKPKASTSIKRLLQAENPHFADLHLPLGSNTSARSVYASTDFIAITWTSTVTTPPRLFLLSAKTD